MPMSAASGKERHDAGARNADGSRAGGNQGRDGGVSGRGGRAATPRGGGGASTGRAVSDPHGLAGGPRGGGTGQGGAGGGTFVGGAGATRDQMQEQDRIGANVASAKNDYDNQGNSIADTVGNFLAGMLGFNEDDPTQPGYSGPGMPGQTGRADWSWDPAGPIGSAIGAGFGAPLTGFLADQISAAAGRPLSVRIGPDVFQDGDSTTVSGSGMTVQDADHPNEFVGVSPGLGFLGQVASNATPKKSTLYGADPAAPAPEPEPQEPAPELPDGLSPINPVSPENINVDPGNTGLQAGDLAGLFQRMGQKVYRGKNRSTVVS
jgi:hypothetical protein